MSAEMEMASPPTILIVEDDEATAELEKRTLVRSGRRVLVASGVREALEVLSHASLLAILLDYNLPDGDPWSVLEAAQRALPRVPVILVTAMGDERVAAEVIHRGGADYIIKTQEFWAELPRALERVVRLSRAEQSNARLAAIVASSDDAIVSKTLGGVIESWNPGAERLFGYTADEAVGRSVTMLVPPDRASEERGILEGVRRGETVRQLETIRVRKDGSLVDVSTTVCPILDEEGMPVGAATVTRDITDKKNAERALAESTEKHRRLEDQLRQAQKMDAIGQLAGGIAHDFNNLLTVINGHTDLVLEQTPEESIEHESLLEVRKAGERAAALTRQILAFSRKQTIAPKALSLNSVITDTHRMLRRLIGEDVELVTVLSPALKQVEADPSQVEQVIVNLAVNARDAMAGGGTLTIETSNVELDASFARVHVGVEPGPYVMLAVSDTGCGMDRETQERIFEPFFTTKEPGRGTGLGLATVFGIVRQSGGHIYVYSEPGHGTTFKTYFPRIEAQIDAAKASAPHAHTPGTETLLVVEDDAQVRRLSCQVLGASGYVVLEATTPVDAIEICRRRSGVIHLLLSDVVMPQMSGPVLARRIGELSPATRVLFVSGYTSQTVAKIGGLEAGTPFLEKPFTPEALLSKIREVLGASGSAMSPSGFG